MPDDGVGSFAAIQRIWLGGEITSRALYKSKVIRAREGKVSQEWGPLPEFGGSRSLHLMSDPCYGPDLCPWPVMFPVTMQTVLTRLVSGVT